MIFDPNPQGSPEWAQCKIGVISASRFRIARDYKEPTAKQKTEGIDRGDPSSSQIILAKDIARERCGGRAPGKFQSHYMKSGVRFEAPGRAAYEAESGNLVEEVGFAYTEDRQFGISLDGKIHPRGAIEVKSLISSETLFRVLGGDLSEYMDQCLGALWLLPLDWIDLCLWAPDLEPMGRALTIHRIHRDENAIRALEVDMMTFARRVAEYERILRNPAPLAMAA